MLLQHGADPNAVTGSDSTPILFAVKNSHANVVRALLEYGAKVNCGVSEKDWKDRTLLMWAAQTGNSETIAMLLEKDVQIKAKDKHGKTALQYACNEQVVIYLERALQERFTYRSVFEISKQEAYRGGDGMVIMARHLRSGNLVALKFHKTRQERDFALSVLRSLVTARRYMATIPGDLPQEEVAFDDHVMFPGFPYCLTTEGGVEDLSETMDAYGSMPMPENQIRYIFECIASSIHILHNIVGRVHHDVKPANFVRFFDGSYRLIDFNNSRVAEKEEMGLTTLEVCPPEMAKSLLSQRKVPSSCSCDIWSIGCILYEMITCQKFLSKFKRDWATSPLQEGLQLVAGLTQDDVNVVIEGLREQKKGRKLVELTTDLMLMMLQVDPACRCTSTDVTLHPFLKGGNTVTMEEKGIAGLHKKVDQVIAITTSIHDRTVNILELSQHTQKGLKACLAKISGLRTLLMETAIRSECPSTFAISPDLTPRDIVRQDPSQTFLPLYKWLDALKKLSMGKMELGDVVKMILGVKHLQLVLLCERCFCKCASYRIEEQPAIIAKLFPAFMVGFQLAKAYNLGASVGRFFFPALPTIPPDMIEKSQSFVESLREKHSATDFECIAESIEQLHADEASGKAQREQRPGSQLGSSYRQLSSFLSRHDPGKEWGGLSLVQTEAYEGELDINGKPNYKGGVLWVCKACLMGIHDDHSRDVDKQQSVMEEWEELSPSSEPQPTSKQAPRSPTNVPHPATAVDEESVRAESQAERSSSSGLCGLLRGSPKKSKSKVKIHQVAPSTP